MSKSIIATCPKCKHEFLFKTKAKRPRPHCPECNEWFYIPKSDAQNTQKEKIIEESNKKAAQTEQNFSQGLITLEEKQRLSNDLWMDTTDEIAEKTWEAFDARNSVKVIISSGGT